MHDQIIRSFKICYIANMHYLIQNIYILKPLFNRNTKNNYNMNGLYTNIYDFIVLKPTNLPKCVKNEHNGVSNN